MAYTKTTWVNNSTPALNETNLNNIEDGIEDVDTRLTTVENKVGGGGGTDIPTNTEVDTAIDAFTYSEGEIDTLLSNKADTTTTYTKTEVDDALNLKADADETYTETEVDTLLSNKADTATTYTKTEVDELVDIDIVDKGSVAVSQSCDLSTANVFAIEPTADLGITFSNIPSGEVVIFFIELLGAGDHTITWPAEVVWDGGEEPSWATDTGTSIAQFYTRDGGTKISAKLLFAEV